MKLYTKVQAENIYSDSFAALVDPESAALLLFHAVGGLVVEGTQLDEDEFVLTLNSLKDGQETRMNLFVRAKVDDEGRAYLTFDADEGAE